ncbi:RsmE family RNA methyltransferase [Persephonella sp.]
MLSNKNTNFPRFIGHTNEGFAYLTDEELKHAKVKRIREKEKIEINDLNGNVYLVEVTEVTKKYLKGKILEKLEIKEEKLKITLYQCVPNQPSKIDDLIESISELGVYKFVPVISKYSAVKEKDIQKKVSKWEKKAVNSIKQCKRLFPLKIENPIKIEDIITEDEGKFVFYEKEKEKNLKDFINKKIDRISVVIGAEGGFTEEEIEILRAKGFVSLTLGKNILRMETAVIAGICQIRFVFG